MRVVFVHGACVKDGHWWWHRTARLLDAHGIRSVTPELPSCGESGIPAGVDGAGLDEDVAAVRRALQSSDEPTILVAHSYGGIVAAQAAAGADAVRHLVLISSYLPEIGQSLADFGDGEPAPFLQVDAVNGTLQVDPDALVETFLQDCPTDIQSQAFEHLSAQSVRVTAQPVAAASWQAIPTTYVVCSQDRGTPAELQRRYAQRADAVVELDTGHHPFLSQPEAIRDLLVSL
ncbi:alpha/beta hydrolase [Microbacterium soli]|uniref:Alpha/beta hydrolase n=1 Tax=Microbacterium soli TaxID=446075 RepID=A0ABP7MVI8_9MICO